MNNSSPPVKIYTAFAQSASPGYMTPVPQTTSTPGQFSWTIGSGPETFLAPGSGGTPPLGDSFNGLMNQMSDNLRWINAGGIFQYDATYSTNIGGYMQNAIVQMASGNGFWRSTVNNNLVNPETGTPSAPAAGWAVITPNTYPWSQITGAPSFVLNSAFTGANQSLVTNGYQKFPGGMIQQWCSVGLTSVSDQISTISFPIVFPSACFNVQVTVLDATLSGANASNQIIGGVSSFSLSSVNVLLGQNGGGARNITVMVNAIGR